jgi:hypothetical protein
MIIEIIGMYLGYKKWGGWTGAFKGLLVVWGVYIAVFGTFLLLSAIA